MDPITHRVARAVCSFWRQTLPFTQHKKTLRFKHFEQHVSYTVVYIGTRSGRPILYEADISHIPLSYFNFDHIPWALYETIRIHLRYTLVNSVLERVRVMYNNGKKDQLLPKINTRKDMWLFYGRDENLLECSCFHKKLLLKNNEWLFLELDNVGRIMMNIPK